MLGARGLLVLPTITLIHMSVIPVLAGERNVFLDGRAHKTIYDGCQLAEGPRRDGEAVPARGPDDLERAAPRRRAEPRLICIDGVNSMTGNAAESPSSPGSHENTTRSSTSTTRTVSA